MKNFALACAISIIISSGTVLAEPVHGPRLELLGGYSSSSAGTGTTYHDVVTYGLRLGYDMPVAARLALGIEGEASANPDHQQVPFVIFTPGVPVGFFSPITPPPVAHAYTAHIRSGRSFYAGARATYALSNRLGVFATAGWANMLQGTCTDPAGSGYCAGNAPVFVGPVAPLGGTSPYVESPRTLNGVRLGGGLSLALGKHLIASAEYRHTRLESHVRSNQLVGAVGWRF